jgi:phage shock protein A
MALLERVATLIRANLNDLIDKAEDPEKMLRQVILDMQNQLMQVKTQVAVAIADQHVLEKKRQEHAGKGEEWMRKAELAVDKKEDELARAALERSMSYKQMAEGFRQQTVDQAAQVENLKSAFSKLEQKLAEAQSRCVLLMAQHRRARALERAAQANGVTDEASGAAAFDRIKEKVERSEAVGQALSELAAESVDDKFAKLEREDEINRMLADLKARRGQ